jgi:hypothetical protein
MCPSACGVSNANGDSNIAARFVDRLVCGPLGL